MFTKIVAALAVSQIVWPTMAAADSYQTPSGKVLCVVTPDPTLPPPNPDEEYDAVVCQGNFTQPGAAYNVTTIGDGTLSWSSGNLATDNPPIRMIYQRNYHLGHWTIRTAPSGTRFKNSQTGHGMFVSLNNVYAF